MKIDAFKLAFPRSGPLIHLNNAGLCPLSQPARDCLIHWASRLHLEGMHCNDDYLEALGKSRGTVARLLGCGAGEVAYFQCASQAISQVALALPLSPGDEILIWDQEYASNFYPWKEAASRSGARLVLAPSGPALSTPVESLISRITDRTRVVAVSWVQYQTGSVTDLAALGAVTRSRGIWTVVDAVQGTGLFPIDFHRIGVDALCTASYKWLAGPPGVGILAVRKDRIGELNPLAVGAHTYGTCDDPASLVCAIREDAVKFESGTRQMLDILSLEASIRLLLDVGLPVIQAETERLAARLRVGLRERGYIVNSPVEAPRGGIVNFSPISDEDRARSIEALKKARVSFAVRGPGLRLSPHAFNTDDDIDGALRALDPLT